MTMPAWQPSLKKIGKLFEKRMRELLEESDLPQPDFVEYGFTCIRLFFNETKVVVVIDIDDPEGIEADVDTDAV